METGEYQAQLRSGNIGVLMGKNSGNLCSIDLDDEGAKHRMFALNPVFENTLESKAQRPGNVWLRMVGEYPGAAKFADADGNDLGEWRANGNQTMIHGTHPSGCSYQFVKEVSPIEIAFDDIKWPDDWVLPWRKDPYDELVEAEGHPYHASPKGGVILNEPFFVAKFMMDQLSGRSSNRPGWNGFNARCSSRMKSTFDVQAASGEKPVLAPSPHSSVALLHYTG